MNDKTGLSSENRDRPFLYRRFFPAPAGDKGFAVEALAVDEIMPPGIVNRPQGTGNRLLMFYCPGIHLQDNEGTHVAAEECAMLWPDGAGHYYGEPERRWRHSWLHFSGSECAALIDAGGAAVNRMQPADYGAAVRHLTAMSEELENFREHTPEICRNIFRNLLLEIGRGRRADNDAVPEGIGWARRRIELDYRHPLTLTALAREACMSRSHFAAEFRRVCGLSPIAYQLHLRLREAAYLLRNRNQRISEIAAQLGFRDPFYFSRIFRKEYRVSPREFRDNNGI